MDGGLATCWRNTPRASRLLLIAFLIFAWLGLWYLDIPFNLDAPPRTSKESRPTIYNPAAHLDSYPKIAAIIETRMTENLIPLILHFSMVLGSSWIVTLFTLQSVWQMPESRHFQRLVREGRVKIQFLPPDTEFADWESVSWFMTRTWLWQQLKAAPRVLIFQTDSIICSNSEWSVEDFMEWDFIGAPLNPAWPQEGFNGGLSLRNPQLMLDILANSGSDFQEKWDANRSDLYVEDRWFYGQMKQMPGVKLPSIDVAKHFSTETIWFDRPLGFHKPLVWNPGHMDEIRQYCPEVSLINREKSALGKPLE